MLFLDIPTRTDHDNLADHGFDLADGLSVTTPEEMEWMLEAEDNYVVTEEAE